MVYDEVLTVGDAETFVPELASVVPRAKPKEANDHVVCSCQAEGFTVARCLAYADAIARRGLTRDRDERFADHQPLRLDDPADAEDHRARAFRLHGLAQAAGPGIEQIRDEEHP